MTDNNFYIGEFYETRITKDKGIDFDGGSIDKAGYSLSGYCSIDAGMRKLYISELFSFPLTVYFFPEDQSEFTTQDIQITDGKPKLIDIPQGTSYIRYKFKTPEPEPTIQPWLQTDYGKRLVAGLAPCTPHYSSLSVKSEKASGEMYFRDSLDGDITFWGRDADRILSMRPSSKWLFVIGDDVYFRGNFTKAGCTMDPDRHSVKVSVNEEDLYTDVLDGYETTYDIIKTAPALSELYFNRRGVMQFYIKGRSTLTSCYGGMYWEDSCNQITDHFTLVNYDTDDATKNNYTLLKPGYEIRIHDEGNPWDTDFGGSDQNWVAANGYTLHANVTTNPTNNNATDSPPRGSLQLLDPTGKVIYESENKNMIMGSYFANMPGEGNGAKDGPVICDARTPVFYNGMKTTFPYDWDDYMGKAPIVMRSIDGNRTFTIQGAIGRDGMPPDVLEVWIYGRFVTQKNYVMAGYDTRAVEIADDDMYFSNTSWKNYKYVCRMLDDNTSEYFDFKVSGKTVTYPTQFGVNDNQQYFTNHVYDDSDNILNILPVCRDGWGNASVWLMYKQRWAILEEGLREDYNNDKPFKQAYEIGDVIKAALKKIAPDLKWEKTTEYSQFLYSDYNPITNEANYNIFITPKTNILVTDFDEPAKKGEFSFKDIMDLLKNGWQLYWFIEDGKFKIENISYFQHGRSYNADNRQIQLDAWHSLDKFNQKSIAYFQNATSFDSNNLYGTWQFHWADTSSDVFDGFTIQVEDPYADKSKNNDISMSKFSSDIDLMMLRPDNFDKEGFAVLVTQKGQEKNEVTFASTLMKDDSDDPDNARTFITYPQNYYASFTFLSRFWMNSMPGMNITYNRLPTGTIQPLETRHDIVRQTISIPFNEPLDYYSFIRTENGNGTIQSISTDIDTRQSQIELGFAITQKTDNNG